jgi:hypothetical protein
MDPPPPGVMGTNSSLARIPAHIRLGHPDRRLRPQACCQAQQGDGDTQSEHHAWHARQGGHDDREGRNLNPEGLGPKVFRSNMCDARFPKCFQAPSNIVKYDARQTPAFGWRITVLCVERARRRMTYSSSSSSPFT